MDGRNVSLDLMELSSKIYYPAIIILIKHTDCHMSIM